MSCDNWAGLTATSGLFPVSAVATKTPFSPTTYKDKLLLENVGTKETTPGHKLDKETLLIETAEYRLSEEPIRQQQARVATETPFSPTTYQDKLLLENVGTKDVLHTTAGHKLDKETLLGETAEYRDSVKNQSEPNN